MLPCSFSAADPSEGDGLLKTKGPGCCHLRWERKKQNTFGCRLEEVLSHRLAQQPVIRWLNWSYIMVKVAPLKSLCCVGTPPVQCSLIARASESEVRLQLNKVPVLWKTSVRTKNVSENKQLEEKLSHLHLRCVFRKMLNVALLLGRTRLVG